MRGLSDAGSAARFRLSLEVSVRLCRRRDLPSLEWWGLFTHHRQIIRQAFRAQERGENWMLLAEVNGAPAGQVWVDLVRSRASGAGFLWALRVVPWLQNLGIGTRLLRCAEERLRRARWSAVEIGVEKKNRAALRLYRRLGYRIAGALRERYGFTPPGGAPVQVQIDEWLLRRDLARR